MSVIFCGRVKKKREKKQNAGEVVSLWGIAQKNRKINGGKQAQSGNSGILFVGEFNTFSQVQPSEAASARTATRGGNVATWRQAMTRVPAQKQARERGGAAVLNG